MRHFPVGLLILSAVLVNSGCLSTFPLDPEPEKAIDSRILGLWRCLPSDADASEEPATLTVRQAGQKSYAVTFEVKGEDASHYDAYPSQLGAAVFVNLRDADPKSSPSSWDYARYSLLLPTVLQIKVVRDTLLKDVEATPAAFREVLQRHADEDSLYGDFCVCVRAKEGDDPAPAHP